MRHSRGMRFFPAGIGPLERAEPLRAGVNLKCKDLLGHLPDVREAFLPGIYFGMQVGSRFLWHTQFHIVESD